MPEFLHPGVYIQETSFRSPPFEGVSTSTAGLVGRTRKGREGRPTLVTSFTEFVRQFGEPFPIGGGAPPDLGDFLGHAVRAFFDNGGKRAYIVRALGSGASAATTGAGLRRGQVYRLPATTTVRGPTTTIPLTSVRGLDGGATGTKLDVFQRDPNGVATAMFAAPLTVASVDLARNAITLAAALPAGVVLAPGSTFFTINGAAPLSTPAIPTFTARSRGADGNTLSVQFRPADFSPTKVTQIVAATLQVTVASTSGFYSGGVVELFDGTTGSYSTVAAVDPGTRTVTLDSLPATVPDPSTTTVQLRTLEIDVLVFENGTVAETFSGLSWNPDNTKDSFRRYFVERMNDPDNGSTLVSVAYAPTATDLSTQPTTADGFPALLGGGDNGAALTDIDLIGQDHGPGQRTGIEALKERTDIALVAVPGVVEETVQAALLTHCELLKYRFAILDGKQGVSDVTAILGHRNNYDSKYGGYYAPWLKTIDLNTGRSMLAPPSGYVLGICARVDNDRGVHKAPANEVVRNVLDVELPFTDGEQDVLNPAGVNLIREFEGRGIRVWGGRCTTSDQEFKYVNVRRLFIFLEHTIDNNTQFVVFEPNTEALWARVIEAIDSFLFGVWKSGALSGTKPEEAYFVRCDRTTMTQDDIDNGRLVCLIGVAPAFPAEFVIFKIGQFTASNKRA